MQAIQDAELSRSQERALIAILAEPTLAAAAKRAKVNEVTIWRWMKQPAFYERYRADRRQMVEQSIGDLQRATTEAVETLRAVMIDPEQPAPTRVTAARAILDHAFRGTELLDLVDRIDRLEALLSDETKESRP
jgi:hypothetical protein